MTKEELRRLEEMLTKFFQKEAENSKFVVSEITAMAFVLNLVREKLTK